MKYTKKIFIILFSFFVIAILVSFSYAYFVKDDIENFLQEVIRVETKSNGDFTNVLTTTYGNDNALIKSQIIDNNNYSYQLKFKTFNSASESQNIIIRWDGVVTNINNLDSSFSLYKCNMADYESSSNTLGESCVNIGRTDYSTLPLTREERLLTNELYEVIQSNATNYYILNINIINNIGNYFYSSVIVDYATDYLTLSQAIEDKYQAVSDSVTSDNVEAVDGINFGAISSTTNGNGLYSNFKNNQNGDIRYFRGEVNNYVSFANMLWRVVRLSADGSARIITNDTDLSSVFNSQTSPDSFYAGYSYNDNDLARTNGFGTASVIMNNLENWYDLYLDDYSNYIKQTAEFCNDTTGYIASGYGQYVDTFSAKTRINNASPSYICPAADRNYGGKYFVRIGTIIVDEVIYAGGLTTADSSFYLNNNYQFWTLSPNYSERGYSIGYGGGVKTYIVSNTGKIVDAFVANSYRVRPVVELKPNTYVTGSGTADDPWVVQ